MDKGVLSEGTNGVPQGGVISQMIANMVQDGLEILIKEKVPLKYINVIRNMEDLIVTKNNPIYTEIIMKTIEEF